MLDVDESFKGFVGTRLTEAREAMGLSVTHLANLLSVSRAIVHGYENDSKSPSSEVFKRICTVLDQPSVFFYSSFNTEEYEHEKVHFRARDSLKDNPREQAGVRLKWMMELYNVLDSKLNLPKLNLPNFSFSPDPTVITQDHIENAAMEVRRLWKLDDDPLPNLIRLLELNGVVVGQINLDLPNLDGLSFWSHKQARPFIVLNADKASYVRSRFDVGHELGHMILHRNIIEGVTRGTPLYKLIESQAHRFASALLLPSNSWQRDFNLPSLVSFKSIKPKWRASIGAMIMRAEALSLISSDELSNLMKQYRRKQWHTREPFDDVWEMERPQLLSQATAMLFESGYSSSTFAQWFPRRIEHTIEITGLPRSYFDTAQLPISARSSNLN